MAKGLKTAFGVSVVLHLIETEITFLYFLIITFGYLQQNQVYAIGTVRTNRFV